MQNLSPEHIGLAARDTVSMKNWYVEILGARELFTDAQTPPAFFVQLPGGLWIEIYPALVSLHGAENNKAAGWRHLALRVDSIEKARADLESRGVPFKEAIKPAGGGGRVLFFQDPEGNLLHLIERPPDAFPCSPGSSAAEAETPPR